MDFVSKKHLIHTSKSCVSQALPPLLSHDPNRGVHSSVTKLPITVIIVVGMFVTSFLLLCYYIFVIKCCFNWNHVDLVRVRRFSISRRYEEQSSAAYSMSSENRGLEEAVIQSIPVIQYMKETDYGERRFCECAVCLNEFQLDEKLRVIPNCSHVFHIDCVDVWLQNNANCPLCRRRISLTCQVQVDQLLTPRSSPQDHSQSVENLIDGDENFVVIDLDDEHDGDQNLQARQDKGKELEVPIGPISPSHMKKARKLHKVTSLGDECVGIRDKDDGFSVQPIKRSFSMDLSGHKEFHVAVQQSLHQQNVHVNEGSSFEVCGDSSGIAKRPFFSFGHGSRYRSSVLPLHLEP